MTDAPRYADKGDRDKALADAGFVGLHETPWIDDTAERLEKDGAFANFQAWEAWVDREIERADEAEHRQWWDETSIMVRATLYSMFNAAVDVACDYLQAKLDESVARAAAREAVLVNTLSADVAEPALSDMARELLEKARNYGALGDESVLKLLVAERDSLRADAEKWRNHRCLQAREALQRENAALRDALRYISGKDVAGYDAHLRAEEVAQRALAQLDAKEPSDG